MKPKEKCTHPTKLEVRGQGGALIGLRCTLCRKNLQLDTCAGCGKVVEHQASSGRVKWICGSCREKGIKEVCYRCREACTRTNVDGLCESCEKQPRPAA